MGKIHSEEVDKIHKELYADYKDRLEELEKQKDEEQEEPFERSFLHNAIYLHRLWFEQYESSAEDTESPLLIEILKRRESDLKTFQTWMSEFAEAAMPNGWAVWGWSYSLKTFVGFPVRSHDDSVPFGVSPLLVIDCWEHSYIQDHGMNSDEYLDAVWRNMNWKIIDERHHELTTLFGYNLK